MGRLRKFAGRLRGHLMAALGSETGSKPAALRDARIDELEALLLDGDDAAFQARWTAHSADPDAGFQQELLGIRAEAELAHGQHDRVAATARQMIEDGRNPLGHFYLARSRHLTADYRGSIEAAQACLFSRPNHVDAAYQLADAAVLAGERELAWRILEQTARRSRRPRTWLLMANLVETTAEFTRLHDSWLQNRSAAAASSPDIAIGEYLALGALRCRNYGLAREIWRGTLMALLADPRKIERARPKVVNYSSRRAETTIADLKRVLDAAGIPMFLISGTLLGCVREGRLLGHDKDIDVGVWDDVEPQRLMDALRGSGLFVVLSSRSPEIVRARHANGIAVDVFFHYREADDYWHGGVKMRWHNKPFGLVPCDFLGERHLVPDNVDRYLTENYGSDWRKPKIDFDSAFDTPNGEVANTDEMAIHSFKMLTDQLVKDAPAKVDFYLDQLARTGERGFVAQFRTLRSA